MSVESSASLDVLGLVLYLDHLSLPLYSVECISLLLPEFLKLLIITHNSRYSILFLSLFTQSNSNRYESFA